MRKAFERKVRKIVRQTKMPGQKFTGIKYSGKRLAWIGFKPAKGYTGNTYQVGIPRRKKSYDILVAMIEAGYIWDVQFQKMSAD